MRRHEAKEREHRVTFLEHWKMGRKGIKDKPEEKTKKEGEQDERRGAMAVWSDDTEGERARESMKLEELKRRP